MHFNLSLLAVLTAGLLSQSALASTLSGRTPAKGDEPGKGAGAGASKSASATVKAAPSPTGGAGAAAVPENKVIKIVVGSTNRNKSLAFTPSEVQAAPGDILQFQFSMMNHTVTQSTFAEPCTPMAEGLNSGFISVGPGEATVQTFDVPVNSTQAMYIYCAQGPHCQLGMVMAVNAGANGTFAAYKAASAKAAANIPAASFKGGVMGSIPAADAVPPPV